MNSFYYSEPMPESWIYENLIFRIKEYAPTWFKEAKLEVPTTLPYYKITIRANDKEHDDYCSGAEEEDCHTTIKTVICYVNELGGITIGDEWNYHLPCRNGLDGGYGSGYCECSDSTAEVIEINQITS
jgi:hypothetical protein